MISKLELSTKTVDNIDLVEGSILELVVWIFPLKAFLNAELVISAFNPGFSILT